MTTSNDNVHCVHLCGRSVMKNLKNFFLSKMKTALLLVFLKRLAYFGLATLKLQYNVALLSDALALFVVVVDKCFHLKHGLNDRATAVGNVNFKKAIV